MDYITENCAFLPTENEMNKPAIESDASEKKKVKKKTTKKEENGGSEVTSK